METSAAPIFRDTDARLRGSCLMKPFDAVRRHIHAAASNPFHPNSIKVIEGIRRLFFHILLRLPFLILSSPLALVGRVIQKCHFKIMSEESKLHPQSVRIMGMSLPKMEAIGQEFKEVKKKVYHGTSYSKSILRSGFKIYPGGNAYRADGVYTINNTNYTESYGCCRMKLEIDLDEREMFQVDQGAIGDTSEKYTNWKNARREEYDNYLNHHWWGCFYKSDRCFKTAMKDLFLANGYRAQCANYSAGKVIVAYDASCVKIKKVVMRNTHFFCT